MSSSRHTPESSVEFTPSSPRLQTPTQRPESQSSHLGSRNGSPNCHGNRFVLGDDLVFDSPGDFVHQIGVEQNAFSFQFDEIRRSQALSLIPSIERPLRSSLHRLEKISNGPNSPHDTDAVEDGRDMTYDHEEINSNIAVFRNQLQITEDVRRDLSRERTLQYEGFSYQMKEIDDAKANLAADRKIQKAWKRDWELAADWEAHVERSNNILFLEERLRQARERHTWEQVLLRGGRYGNQSSGPQNHRRPINPSTMSNVHVAAATANWAACFLRRLLTPETTTEPTKIRSIWT